jgi:hypothetical protein
MKLEGQLVSRSEGYTTGEIVRKLHKAREKTGMKTIRRTSFQKQEEPSIKNEMCKQHEP